MSEFPDNGRAYLFSFSLWRTFDLEHESGNYLLEMQLFLKLYTKKKLREELEEKKTIFSKFSIEITEIETYKDTDEPS